MPYFSALWCLLAAPTLLFVVGKARQYIHKAASYVPAYIQYLPGAHVCRPATAPNQAFPRSLVRPRLKRLLAAASLPAADPRSLSVCSSARLLLGQAASQPRLQLFIPCSAQQPPTTFSPDSPSLSKLAYILQLARQLHAFFDRCIAPPFALPALPRRPCNTLGGAQPMTF